MTTTLTDEQTEIRDLVRRFARDEVAPLAYEIDRDERFPRESWQRAAELGLLGISAPTEHGGTGLGLTELCLAGEELAAVCMSTSATLLHQADMVVDSIVRNGTEDQQARLLPGLCDGSVVACLAITEAEAGSDALAMQTRAERVDGGWALTGSKTFITNGPVADLALVYARCGEGPRDLGLFAVRTDVAGFSRGSKLEKMGWRGSPTGELVMERCFVPEDDVIGGAGNGLRVLMSGLNSERILIGAQCAGIAQGALDASIAYARERRQFGRPIGDFQLIRAKLADMYAETAALRALVYQGAAQAEQGDVGELRLLASAVKVLGADVAMRATTEAVQIFGGYGYTKEYPVERYMRDAKLMQIGGGTSEIQRDLLGRTLIG